MSQNIVPIVNAPAMPGPDAATENRERLRREKVLGVNVVGGPGCGKTALLSATMDLLRPDVRVGVVAADPATHQDADLLLQHADQVVQIDTGEERPLDAALLCEALGRLNLSAIDLLFMENLGTLLRADADVGLDALAVVFSVAQGQGQPEKHPHLVSKADVILLNKVDLLPSVAYDLNAFRLSVQRIHPGVTTLEVSALLREKLEPWVRWLKGRIYKNFNGNGVKQNGSHWFG